MTVAPRNPVCFKKCLVSARKINLRILDNGIWAVWESWSGCSQTCGLWSDAFKWRRRRCKNASHGGTCNGKFFDYEKAGCPFLSCPGSKFVVLYFHFIVSNIHSLLKDTIEQSGVMLDPGGPGTAEINEEPTYLSFGIITGFRIRHSSLAVHGLQFRFGNVWGTYKGGTINPATDTEQLLQDNEYINYVYGNYFSRSYRVVVTFNIFGN